MERNPIRDKTRRNAIYLDNLSWTRLGSLMTLKGNRSQIESPPNNNTLYSTPRNLEAPNPTTSKETPWSTPKSSPKFDRTSMGSIETDDVFETPAESITWSRMGSLKSNKDRPLPKTPGDNNNYYSVPRSHTPMTSSNTTPWATPRGSPKFDKTSISSDSVDGGNNTSIGEGPHMSIEQWLTALELYDQYGTLFERFSGVEQLINKTEAEIRQLGVKNSAHRARIVTSLTALREKYKRSKFLRNRIGSVRHSVAVESSRKVHDIQHTFQQTRPKRR